MAARPCGGRISLTAFELDWLTTILASIDPINIDALAHVQLPVPKDVQDDPHAAWERLMDKVVLAKR